MLRVHELSKPLTHAALIMLVGGIGLLSFSFGRSNSLVPGAVGTPDWLFAGAASLILGSVATLVWLRARSAADNLRDPVSGLFTRRHVDCVLPALTARDDRAGESQLAVLLLEIDHLDAIERRYGLHAVDAVMRLVGGQVCGQSRAEDLPCLHDERRIAVFLRCREAEQAAAFARRISMLLSGQQIDWRGDVIKVTASMGIVIREPGEPGDRVLERAAAKLAEASAAGGDRIVA